MRSWRGSRGRGEEAAGEREGEGGDHRDNLKDSRSQVAEGRSESGCRRQTEGKTAGSEMKEEEEEELAGFSFYRNTSRQQ